MKTVFGPLESIAGRAATIGFVAGLRSQMPLAILAISARAGNPGHRGTSPRSVLARTGVVLPLCLSAVGEVVVDKTPVVPSRLDAGPLGGRVFFGSLAGALISRERSGSAISGLAPGALGALAGSYAGYQARNYLVQTGSMPDAFWAVLEDVAALGLGVLATHRFT